MNTKILFKILLFIAGASLLTFGAAVFFDVNVIAPINKSWMLIISIVFNFAAMFVGKKALRDEKQEMEGNE